MAVQNGPAGTVSKEFPGRATVSWEASTENTGSPGKNSKLERPQIEYTLECHGVDRSGH